MAGVIRIASVTEDPSQRKGQCVSQWQLPTIYLYVFPMMPPQVVGVSHRTPALPPAVMPIGGWRNTDLVCHRSRARTLPKRSYLGRCSYWPTVSRKHHSYLSGDCNHRQHADPHRASERPRSPRLQQWVSGEIHCAQFSAGELSNSDQLGMDSECSGHASRP